MYIFYTFVDVAFSKNVDSLAPMASPKKMYIISKPNKIAEFKPVSFMRRGHSPTRSVLHFLKMKRGVPVTARATKEMFPRFFGGPVDASRILKTLERRGFAQSAYEGSWRITASGLHAINLLAQRDKRKHCDYEEEMNS